LKPRVLFLDHTGGIGGAELILLDVVKWHGAAGSVVLFADGPFRERLEEVGAEVGVLPAPGAVNRVSREGKMVRNLRSGPGVLRLARRVARLSEGYDLLYANSQKAFVVGALAGRIVGKPIIWHQHDLLTPDHFSRGLRRLAVALANHLVERVIVNSRATAEAFVASGGRAEKVRLVYNGIDPAPFGSIVQTEVDALRRELGLDGVPVVGVFSRLAPWKGQHVLLEALTRLPGVHALLVGDAVFGEHAYAEALRDQSKTLGIEDRVHFAGFRRDIPQLMRLSGVVAHTSVDPEPFGRVIVEGMLAGRPVVATRAGGAVEIVEDGTSGVLVPPRDATALASALSDLLADPARADAIAEAGREAALEFFSLRAMLEGITRQLQEVAAGRQRGS
jgi:glycosyltransferase involved in cell wall biosynthesis